jgi:hypothetical protein
MCVGGMYKAFRERLGGIDELDAISESEGKNYVTCKSSWNTMNIASNEAE